MQPIPHLGPRALMRRGPRPLLLHLAMAMTRLSSSASGSPSSNDVWQSWIATLCQPNLGASAPLPEACGPDAALIHGIAAYRRHPYQREVSEPAVIWQHGEMRLFDYGGSGAAPPVLLIPSLINRATILDLHPTRSLARWLAAHEVRVRLLDWGWPDASVAAMDLGALITERLQPAMQAASQGEQGVTLVGYCMGGLLATAAAQLWPERVAGLGLLATPWDFFAGGDAPHPMLPMMLAMVEPVLQLLGQLPVDVLQWMFSLDAPHAVGDKYRAFGRLQQDSERAGLFVAIEDWLNDGVPLSAVVARQCLHEFYGKNAPARGHWRVHGQVIDPQTLNLPCLVAVPQRDRIVPPTSALPLAEMLNGAQILRPSSGHVSMVVGQAAQAELWHPLAAWARSVPSFRRTRGRRRVAG